MRNKMLFITSELPYPLQSGGKVKTWNMLKALSEYWDITLVCPLKKEDQEHLTAFSQKASVQQMYTDAVDIPRSAVNLIKSYLQAKPLNLLRTYSDSLHHQVDSICDDYPIILIDHYESFQLLPARIRDNRQPKQTLIYHAHNAYHQIWQRYGENTKNLAEKAVCVIETKRVKQCEKDICEQADIVFAAPNDTQTLMNIGCQGDKFRNTLHLGDDLNLTQPVLELNKTRHKLCYVGLLNWEPNVQGLLWFIEHVWPQLKQRKPDIELDIAGKHCDERLRAAVEASEGIRLLGFVEDLEDLYQQSRICISPLLFGSGIKVKVASALARGIPTVTTSIGAEGLEVSHKKHMMIADTPLNFTNHIVTLMEEDMLWSSISRHSRRLMKERYNWKVLFESMVTDILSQHYPRQNNIHSEHCSEPSNVQSCAQDIQRVA